MLFGEGSIIRKSAVWRSGVAVRAYKLLRRAAEKLHLQVVLKTFYSPIPDLDALPPGAWERTSAMGAIDWDVEAQLRYVEQTLAPYIPEFKWTREPTGEPYAYYELNDTYGIVDATTTYAIVRHLRPKRVLEMGSGFTTLTLAQACRANAADGAPVELDVYDPFPGVIDDGLPGLARLNRIHAQDIPLATFASLEAGDIIFIDTTHTVKMGSEVNYFILDVLPMLNPGVVVHFHDICLPWEYRRELFEDYGLYWNEQYLLQAFLQYNREWEILCGIFAVSETYNDRIRKIIPTGPGGSGGGFWMQRR